MNKKPKKILIFTVSGDLSTDKVTDWLIKKGYEVMRCNVDTGYENESTSFELNKDAFKSIISVSNIEINIDEIKSVWVRKYINPDFPRTIKFDSRFEERSNDIYNYLTKEYSFSVFSLIEFLKEGKKVLGGKITKQPSKYEMLLAARNIGIDIPNTLITTKKSHLLDFLKRNYEIITKPIKEVELFTRNNSDSTKIYASTYTELLNESLIEKIPDNFFVSLFQEKLNKKYEIRSFFLNGKFYSSAIFSQSDNQTDVDFRMYNNKKPNRVIPYELTKKDKNKLKLLMESLGLKSGSLDLIKTIDGRLVFLEVNPWGQYGMVGTPCNYNLNKKIANFLIDEKEY